MNREQYIYGVYTVLAFALSVYCASLTISLGRQFGSSLTTAIMLLATICFIFLCCLFGVITYVFSMRFVSGITRTAAGFELKLSNQKIVAEVQELKYISKIGQQFSSEEGKPEFVIFSADRRLSVAQINTFQSANKLTT
jgi:hypothetical protein